MNDFFCCKHVVSDVMAKVFADMQLKGDIQLFFPWYP